MHIKHSLYDKNYATIPVHVWYAACLTIKRWRRRCNRDLTHTQSSESILHLFGGVMFGALLRARGSTSHTRKARKRKFTIINCSQACNLVISSAVLRSAVNYMLMQMELILITRSIMVSVRLDFLAARSWTFRVRWGGNHLINFSENGLNLKSLLEVNVDLEKIKRTRAYEHKRNQGTQYTLLKLKKSQNFRISFNALNLFIFTKFISVESCFTIFCNIQKLVGKRLISCCLSYNFESPSLIFFPITMSIPTAIRRWDVILSYSLNVRSFPFSLPGNGFDVST